VQLSKEENDGSETLIGVISEGDTFGERALLTGKLYSETALALTRCEIFVLGREQYEAFVSANPHLRRTIDAYLSAGEQDRAPGKLAKRRR
jgi:CRP-like cAMP-binding protein